MSGCIAVINAGSSSVKFALCADSDTADILFRGQIEGIGVAPRLNVKDAAVMERLRHLAEKAMHVLDRAGLLGIEGEAAALYFNVDGTDPGARHVRLCAVPGVRPRGP